MLHRRNPLHKIYFSFLLFSCAIVFGVGGFMYLQHYTFIEALYMTVITLATVGYTEVRPLDDTGRIFAVVLILSNLAIFTYFVSVVSRFFMDGEFNQLYKNNRMNKSIDQLEGHTIICGFGRNGLEASKVFTKNNVDVVIIERHFEGLNAIATDMHYYIEGDATNDDVLLKAGIKKAHALISALPDDAANVFVVLTARELNPNLKIISRAGNDTSVKKLKRAGANNVIMPDKIGGAHMATLILSPDVKEFMDIMSTTTSADFQIMELTVSKELFLENIFRNQKTGTTLLGVKTLAGEYLLNPPQTLQLKINERIIAMGSHKQLLALKALVH